VSHLVVIVYPDQYRADEIIAAVQRVRQWEEPETTTSLSVARDPRGNPHLGRSPAVLAGGDPASDLITTLAGYLMRALGAPAPGASDADDRTLLHALGMSGWFLRRLRIEFTEGKSAIIHLTPNPDTDATLTEICKFSGIVLQTALAHDAEQRLREFIATQCR
jgi:uncharacterized membrane protein